MLFTLINLLIFFVFVTVGSLVHQLGMVIACLVLRIRLSVVCIGSGPLFTTIQTRVAPIKIHWLFPGGYIKLADGELARVSLSARVCFQVAGPVVLLASSALFIPATGVYQHFISTLSNFYAFASVPKALGCDIWKRYFDVQLVTPLIAYGIVAAKMSAVNLFPIPVLNGGRILLDVLGIDAEKNVKTAEYMTTIGALVIIYPAFKTLQSLYFYLVG